MVNVLVYALPNRNSGGLSVVSNLYHDFRSHEDEYGDIHWFFITSVDSFESTPHITVRNDEWALKTWAHRWYYNKFIVKKYIKDNDIDVTISINMNPIGGSTPNIISMHNVLPLYRCGYEVFDSLYWISKQFILNRMMVRSYKSAKAILIPSRWIRHALIEKFKIDDRKIYLSQIPVPEVSSLLEQKHVTVNDDDEDIVFIYPASSYLYKNHMVIVKAVKLLKEQGVDGYRVLFAGYTGSGRTVEAIKEIIRDKELPIEIKGNIGKQELVEIYRKSVLIFPSKIETDAFPILESMACGGEIISASLPYAREALEGYDRVSFFDVDDYEGLADIMREVMYTYDANKHGRAVERENIRPRSETIVPIIRRIVKK